MDLRFVEPGAHTQLRNRGEHLHGDVLTAVLVEQAHGAQCTPETAEAGADNQDGLFHS